MTFLKRFVTLETYYMTQHAEQLSHRWRGDSRQHRCALQDDDENSIDKTCEQWRSFKESQYKKNTST